MSNQNEIIRQIFAYLPNNKVSFQRVELGLILSIDVDKKLFITKDDVWDMVKLKIDKRLSNEPRECGICYNNSLYKVSCVKCTHSMCVACHLILIIENKGQVICPICRVEHGDKLQQQALHERIGDLLTLINDDKYYREVKTKICEHLTTKFNSKFNSI